jgi:hypothetical protein
LKKVYAEVDKYSNLLWSARDEFELLNRNASRGCRNTRRGANQEEKENSNNWQKETKATFGYGEITRVSPNRLHQL